MSSTAPSAVMPPGIKRRRAALTDFVAVAQGIAGTTCQGIVACGPAVAGHPDAAVDTAVVLTGDELPFLRTLARSGRRFDGAGLGAPLVLTTTGMATSRDCFPLELLDLQQCHWPLHGDVPLATLSFAPEHVRLQCERELKSLTIQLRRRLLAAAGKETALMLADLGDEVVRVARGLLLLHGQVGAREAPAVLESTATVIGRPLPASLAAWRGAAGWDAFAAFYAEVESLWSAVDAR